MGVAWRPNIEPAVIDILEAIQSDKRKHGSRDEVEYILGAAYFLDHSEGVRDDANGVELYRAQVLHEGIMYDAIGFREPFQYWSGEAPSAMAFVPQLAFDHNTKHHDLGVFTSGNHAVTPAEWHFDCAIEIDVHPYHQLQPQRDKFRDSLVKYRVIRLNPSDDPPLTWFRRFRSLWSEAFA